MKPYCFCICGNSPALCYAMKLLEQEGYPVTEYPDDSVTHLLLPVPSLDQRNYIKGGLPLEEVLCKLNGDVTIFGGNLQHPALDNYHTIDLLQDPVYVAQNAAITAHCAIELAMSQLSVTLQDCRCLVIGWGRIGKCLAKLLGALGADVTVAARKDADRAMAEALGYEAVATNQMQADKYRVIFNTAPQLLLPDCTGSALKIDLASIAGITGPNVLWARGLPSKMAPESSGQLIAKRILYYIKENRL